MSTERGNTSRQRSQKHKNTTAFKNDLHDKSPKMKLINSILISNVCRKCTNILEWKIKYKKFKPLKAPRKCTKCEKKSILEAYHIMCAQCSKTLGVCPKCGKNEEIVRESVSKTDQIDLEIQQMLKSLSERKRRTFLRYASKQHGEAKSEESDPKDLKKELMVKLESLKLDSEACDLPDESDIESEDEDDPSPKEN